MRALVRIDASLRVVPTRRLRGDIKLSYALETFGVSVAGRVALDIGASTGGFTTALLDRGARRVYAVDVGVGQLLGRLRNDARVVNLEGHNLGSLDQSVVPDTIELVTMDLSYLAISDAAPQLNNVILDTRADLIALIKPTFELHRSTVAASDDDITDAIAHAAKGITDSAWQILGRCHAPITGRHGAREAFVHATRSAAELSGA